jgi:hypothetical protein
MMAGSYAPGQQYAVYTSYPSMVIPGQMHSSAPMGQWTAASSTYDPRLQDYYYQQQYQQQQPQAYQAVPYSANPSMVYGIIPTVQQPYSTGIQHSNTAVVAPGNPTSSSWHPQQNNWDPVMSTNVSQSIASMASKPQTSPTDKT